MVPAGPLDATLQPRRETVFGDDGKAFLSHPFQLFVQEVAGHRATRKTVPRRVVGAEINLRLPPMLPADFCGDVHEHLSIYKRLANCAAPDKVDDMQEELIDRFG